MARGDGILDDEEREEARSILDDVDLRAIDALRGDAPEPMGMSAAERDARAPTQPGSTFASVPGARRTGATGVVLPGVPAGPPPDRSQRSSVILPSEDEIAVRPVREEAPSPTAQPSPMFAMPRPDMRVLDGEEPAADPVEERALASLAGSQPADAAPSKPAAAEVDPSTLIPGADDISGARGRDIPRRMLHGLANALRVLGGRAPNRQFRSEAEELEARQRQMLGDKRTARTEERAVASQEAQEARRAAADQRAIEESSFRRSMAEREASLAERTADRQDAQSAAQVARLGEQTAAERSERELGERLRNPASTESGTARGQLRALLEGVSTRDRSRVQPLLDQLDSMSADDAERMMTRGPQWLRDLLHRRGGGTGGGGAGLPVDRGSLVTEAEGLGISRSVAEATPTRELRSMIAREQAARGRADATAERTAASAAVAPELVPGSGIRAGGRLATGEDSRWRDGYTAALSGMGGIRRVGEIAQRFGRTGAAFSPEAGAALEPELVLLRSMVAEMGGTGVINPSEVPTINAALPNPANIQQMTFDTFQARMGQWRRILEDRVRARLVSMGVDREGQDRLVRGLFAGQIPAARAAAPAEGGAQAPSARPGHVRMRFNGRTGWVPEAQVQQALSEGAERVD